MVKVVIAEDSSTIRYILKKILDSDPKITVVASAKNGIEAVELVAKHKPDLVTMDIRMPLMNGFEATQEIMKTNPTPILVISSSVNSDDLNITFNAIKAGALDIVEKPKGNYSFDFEKISKRLINKVKILSEVKVIRHRGNFQPKLKDYENKAPAPTREYKRPIVNEHKKKLPELIAIVSSTGGPKALLRVLSQLDKNFPIPICVVQHITPGFGQGLITWLNRDCPIEVKFAEEGEKLKAGTVYFAKDDRHLTIKDKSVKYIDEDAVVGLRPYGNYLLDSIAKDYAADAIGIVLTGMGRDGADGLKKMKDKGAYTIGQDEKSCVVYGMPKEALDIGALSTQMPLDEIAGYLTKMIMVNK